MARKANGLTEHLPRFADAPRMPEHLRELGSEGDSRTSHCFVARALLVRQFYAPRNDVTASSLAKASTA